MSTVDNFNRIDDCDKIDPRCIDAYFDYELDPDNPTGLCIHTPWGGDCLDLISIVKAGETLTTLYLSPEEDPNCLVYEPERGDNICIHGDDLSRIISMRYLKDVDQTTPPSDGIVYMYDSETNLFEPYDLKTTISNINTAIQNINQTLANHEGRIASLESRMTAVENRVTTIEEKIAPPEGCPSGARIVHGVINIYGDYNAAVDGSGSATSLDKTHGLYSHSLNTSVANDQIMG